MVSHWTAEEGMVARKIWTPLVGLSVGILLTACAMQQGDPYTAECVLWSKDGTIVVQLSPEAADRLCAKEV